MVVVNLAIKVTEIRDTKKCFAFFVSLRNLRFPRDFLAINGLNNDSELLRGASLWLI